MSSSESEARGESSSVPGMDDYVSVHKFVVFESCLEEVLRFCPECRAAVVTRKPFTMGSMVGYRLECHSGHTKIWRSQPTVNRQPVGNLLLTSAILKTGKTYGRLKDIASAVNLQMFSRSSFSRLQRDHVFSVIQEAWEKGEAEYVVESLQSSEPVVLAGDARADTRGRNAKFSSYTYMHADGYHTPGPRKIVDVQLVQVTEVKNANHMEPEGLRRGLKQIIKRHKVPATAVATG